MNPNNAKIVNKDNFEDILKIFKFQNCVIGTKEIEIVETPADAKARAIREKLERGKKLVESVKKKQSIDSIDFADIVSSVSTKSNTYNKHSVWDMTLYQLYDEYRRLEAISNFDINIMAMTQGAKIEDLKHWSQKID